MKKQFDTDQAWTRLYDRMVRNGQVEMPISEASPQAFPFFRQHRLAWRMAASVLFVMATAFLLYASVIRRGLFTGTNMIVTEQNEEIRNIILPDGSVVYLNSDTRFTWPKKFKEDTRTVSLEGEAYFEVTADNEHPFVIETGEALVRAVGTSFNVNGSGRSGDRVEVFVQSGRVDLVDAGNINNHVMLEPGHTGALVQGRLESSRDENRNCIAWKTRQMDFQHTPLSEVVEILQDVYKVEIIIPDHGIDTTRIIGNYSNDSLDMILEIICTQNHLKVEKSDQKIYLSHR